MDFEMIGALIDMSKEELIKNITFLVNKFIPEREDLIRLIENDSDSAKYILAEIDRYKNRDYDGEDLELLADIAYYYI